MVEPEEGNEYRPRSMLTAAIRGQPRDVTAKKGAAEAAPSPESRIRFP
jgi:hypothetical protein